MYIASLIISLVCIYLSIVWITFLLIGNFNKKERKKQLTELPGVTITIPALNEEKTIISTLKSVISLRYPKNKIQIIVAINGSTDNTAKIVKSFIKNNPAYDISMLVRKKPGKGDALNEALKQAKYEYFAVVDSDTTLHKNSLKLLVAHFLDEKIAASISAIKVKNPNNIYGRVQRIEYILTILAKKLMESVNTLFVTPGALSVYRTSILKKTGGFDSCKKHLSEDLEIALRLKYLGYNIATDVNAETYTNVPLTFKSIWKQRLRWYRGFIFNSLKYRKMFFNKKYDFFGMFQMPLNVVGPILLFSAIFFMLYNIATSTYNFILRSILIKDFFVTQILSISTPKQIILGSDFKIILPAFIGLIFFLFMIYKSHKLANEKIKDPVAIIFYLFVYPIIVAFHWIGAVTEELIFRKKKTW